MRQVMREIYRVSRRYILAIEYFASEDTSITYRGESELLWKRDFGAHYQKLPLDLLSTGYLGPERGFDRCNWWLLQKPQ